MGFGRGNQGSPPHRGRSSFQRPSFALPRPLPVFGAKTPPLFAFPAFRRLLKGVPPFHAAPAVCPVA